MKFKSKVDWWLFAILVAIPLSVIAFIVLTVIEQDPDIQLTWAITTGIMFIVSLLIVPALFDTSYTLEEEVLLLRGGLFKQSIAYDKILSAKPSNNPLSTPYTLSMRRMRINYLNKNGKERFVLISPADREEFARELRKKNRSIEIE